MTYPPQSPGPPGPYGGQQGGPYRQQRGPYERQSPQPAPYSQPTAYQGLGSFSGGQQESTPPPPPPKKSNTNMIIAVVLAAVLVLGGAGAAIFFLTKDDGGNGDGGSAGSGNSQANPPGGGSNDNKPDDRKPSTKPSSGGGSSGSESPAAVQQAYIEAYESKQFGDVVQGACAAYKEKFGTDTSELESQLEPFTIKATADGRPEITGSSAIARIDLELAKGSEIKRPKIKIKIVKEDSKWRFCGEGEA